MQQRLRVYIAAVYAFTAVVIGIGLYLDAQPPFSLPLETLPVLAVGLVAAELLRVRFRRRSSVDALTLFDALLAPLIFAFPMVVVVSVVGVVQLGCAVFRRTQPVKAAFNTGQWMLAAAAGSLVADRLLQGPFLSLRSLGVFVLTILVVNVVNVAATTGVRSVAEDLPVRRALAGLRPVLGTTLLSFSVNLLFGLLFVLAAKGHPAATVLFPAPLVLLHYVLRQYAAAQTDGRRLSGLRAAAEKLSRPINPLDGVHAYLAEVRTSFDSGAAALVLRQDDGVVTYVSGTDDVPGTDGPQRPDRVASAIERLLAVETGPIRLRAGETGHLASALADAGWRESSSAPMVDEKGEPTGALVVFDQVGFEGTGQAELAVLEALARETGHTLARGRLLESVIDQERTLNQIISTTSDGIFTLADDGSLLTWNDACERITGFPQTDLKGRRDVMRVLGARTAAGRPVDFTNWVSMPSLPREILITTAAGEQGRLSCSATSGTDSHGRQTLVVVARDVTPAEEYEELREQFRALVEAQAAQRLVVDHLQQAVAPEPPAVEGADIAVAYVASDPASPTGGDLFDWHELPSGELHVAVVDVLGHGVTATKDALTVMHMLRFVALDGTELVDVVRRTDELLGAQDSELVATVVVARYDPRTGRLQVVSGGHPPALVVGSRGEVTQLAATGGAIGWPGVGSDNVATITLEVHDSVVLYTDGLIEARKDIIEGMDSLVRVAAEVSHMPSQHYADELVRRSLAGADRRDDTLALVLRRTRQTAVETDRRWRLEPPEPEGVRTMRRELGTWLMAHQVESDDAVLVAAELLANAASVARGVVTMSVQMQTGRVVVEVSDDGPGVASIDDLGRRLPGMDSERGRGLYLVRAISDDLSIMSTAEGTIVRAELVVRGVTAEGRRVHDPQTH
ncbi:ATP-binding SpoIIE family protein phosphatase [Solicola sp. PLA-1-18]|uniref:ATP-binding SpoIIE family protein phosphatase n=1 Tax=Solicola sp. PLA-1-18 TaxID=3380532 RepID=UPI003B7BA938